MRVAKLRVAYKTVRHTRGSESTHTARVKYGNVGELLTKRVLCVYACESEWVGGWVRCVGEGGR